MEQLGIGLLELGSFLAMLYSSIIVAYIGIRGRGSNRGFIGLALLLTVALLSHGMHHLSGFLDERLLELLLGEASAVSALAVGLLYFYLWGRV